MNRTDKEVSQDHTVDNRPQVTFEPCILSSEPSEKDTTDPPDSPKTGLLSKLPFPLVIALKLIALLIFLYFFICSLDLLASAFRLLGGRAASQAFHDSKLLTNPIAGLMIGVLATVLLQSSSTTTSIIVAIVASGVLEVRRAIPMVMGANIGTSVTNTIVSLGQAGKRDEFERAFGGATVHDMFNWLTVAVLLPVEIITGMLYRLTGKMVNNLTSVNVKKIKLLKVITEPFTKLIIQIDKDTIKKMATNPNITDLDIMKRYCSKENETEVYCSHIFARSSLSNAGAGAILLICSLLVLVVCLILLVKTLNSMLKGKTVIVAKKVVNQNFPKPFSWLTGYLVILVGALMTILVQSSSVFTSAMTPLVGIGVLSLERMYPLTLGSNIGTTFTSVLAALTANPSKLHDTVQVALCHLFFNIIGIMLFYPIPFMRWPIGMAQKLGKIVGKYRWFAAVYLAVMFGLLPLLVFCVSLGGPTVTGVVIGPIVLVILLIIVINILQDKKPGLLPEKLRNWNFLPDPFHELEFWDGILKKMWVPIKNCTKKKHKKGKKSEIWPMEEKNTPKV